MPGIAYILVKDRSKIKCGLSSSWSVSTLCSGSQRKSWKHSSTSSRAPTSAQRSIPFFTSPFGVSSPVGLLGLHSTTRSISGVTASQYAFSRTNRLPRGAAKRVGIVQTARNRLLRRGAHAVRHAERIDVCRKVQRLLDPVVGVNIAAVYVLHVTTPVSSQ